MDLAMVKQEQGETLHRYMRHFFDKCATVVDVTDKEVIDLFQDELYHRRTFEDFGRRRLSSITKLKDMITSWADEEDKANAKYDSIRGKRKNNIGGNNNNDNNNNNNNNIIIIINNNRDQGGRNNNNYSGPNRKRKPDNIVATIQRPAKDNSKKTSSDFKDLLKEKCLWHLRATTPPSSATNSASTQRHPRPTASSRQERQEESRRRQQRLPGTRQDGERPLR
jgi:hypothetical protein